MVDQMTDIRDINDSNWQEIIGDKPALILLTTGTGLRGDFTTQFKKSAQEQNDIIFAQVNPTDNPQIAAQFNFKEKPIMVG